MFSLLGLRKAVSGRQKGRNQFWGEDVGGKSETDEERIVR